MSPKNIKMTSKLKQQLVDSVSYYAQARLTDEKLNPDFINLADKFDVEVEVIQRAVRSTVIASVGVLSEFLKITSTEKNKIEGLHKDIMASTLVDNYKELTPKAIEDYQKTMKDLYNYDFSDLEGLDKSFRGSND